MSVPAGYSMSPAGFYYGEAGDGPYSLDENGNLFLLGSGTSSGGSSGGGSEPPTDPVEELKVSYIVSGGRVVWLGGLNFEIQATTYVIQGTQYSIPQTTFALSAADATNPRIDIIALNTDPAVEIIAGTPAATPAEPSIDPETQLKVSFVNLGANDVAPDEVAATEVVFYKEGTEVTNAKSGAQVTLDSVSSPLTDTKSILWGSSAASGNYHRHTLASDIDLNSYNDFIFRFKLETAWASPNAYLNIGFYSSTGVLRGSLVSFKPGDYGTSASATTEQLAVIPRELFNAGGQAVRRVQFTLVKPTGATTPEFRVDDIVLQGTASVVVDSTKLSYEGAWSANRLYNRNSVVTDCGFIYVALTATTNQRPSLNTAVWALLSGFSWFEVTDSATLTSAHMNNGVAGDKATAINITVPPNADVPCPIGTSVLIAQEGAGQITLVAGAGVTLSKGSLLTLKTKEQNSLVSIVKRDTNIWYVGGDLEAV